MSREQGENKYGMNRSRCPERGRAHISARSTGSWATRAELEPRFRSGKRICRHRKRTSHCSIDTTSRIRAAPQLLRTGCAPWGRELSVTGPRATDGRIAARGPRFYLGKTRKPSSRPSESWLILRGLQRYAVGMQCRSGMYRGHTRIGSTAASGAPRSRHANPRALRCDPVAGKARWDAIVAQDLAQLRR